MSIAALVTWITAVGGGLYLLSIWLIEYDKEFHSVAATRLPPLVLFSHVTFAAGGLFVWVGYLVFDAGNLAWTALIALLLAATLGLTMAIRWVSVYRDARAVRRAAASQSAVGLAEAVTGRSQVTTVSRMVEVGPPERNFPLPVVIGHGLFAITTITLVFLTALGVGS